MLCEREVAGLGSQGAASSESAQPGSRTPDSSRGWDGRVCVSRFGSEVRV